jgi:transposase
MLFFQLLSRYEHPATILTSNKGFGGWVELTRFRGDPTIWDGGFSDGQTYLSPEFRQQLIALVRAGRTPESLAKEFEPSAQTIRNWAVQADRDGGLRTDGLTTDERAEMTRLRRENRQLKLERDILSKAAAWFARETGTIPSGSTDS